MSVRYHSIRQQIHVREKAIYRTVIKGKGGGVSSRVEGHEARNVLGGEEEGTVSLTEGISTMQSAIACILALCIVLLQIDSALLRTTRSSAGTLPTAARCQNLVDGDLLG